MGEISPVRVKSMNSMSSTILSDRKKVLFQRLTSPFSFTVNKIVKANRSSLGTRLHKCCERIGGNIGMTYYKGKIKYT